MLTAEEYFTPRSAGLKEMTVDARGEMEAVGVAFIPIVNYPVNWTI